MKELIELLKRIAVALPVEWDRYCVSDDTYTIYGWFERKDSKRDFLLLEVDLDAEGLRVGFTTSSAKYSSAINTFFNGSTHEHNKCIKIQELFALETES